MASNAREASTTIKDFAEGYEETCMRSDKVYAKLLDQGNVDLNIGGDGMQWQVQYARGVGEGNKGDTSLTFTPVDRFFPVTLYERGYVFTDAMKKREYVKNKGPAALIKYFSKMGKCVLDDLKRQFIVEPFIDGSATGNEDRLEGLKTFSKHNGNSVNKTTGALRAYDASDYVMDCGSTYGGLTCGLADYGGSITGVWPLDFTANTDGDTYDFFTPVIVNYVSTSFGGTTATWKDQGPDAVRYLCDALSKDGDSNFDMVVLSREMYRLFKAKMDPYQRVNVENTGLRKLGFNDVINFDGVDVTGHFGVPAGEGYGFSTEHLFMRSYQSKVFAVEGPTWNQQAREFRVVGDFIGNLKATSPKYFGRLVAGSGSAE